LGIYRNWATDSPVMKDVYESIMLDPDPSSPRYDYNSFSPDVIVMCIGANDLSDGDGVTPRAPFDSTRFITAYISFISNIHQHHPEAKLLLLNGPVNPPVKDALFKACLTSIQSQAARQIPGLAPITTFFFPLIEPLGCGGHPDLMQQATMAEQLEPVLEKILKSE
jgi:lysophospholipase L1-like esterase